MNPKDFIKTSTILGGATLLHSSSVYAQSLQQRGMDKLTEKDGNFVLQPLPNAETLLEPCMDQEIVHLHYTFHQGDAVKDASKELQMIKLATDQNNAETIDYRTKMLAVQLSSYGFHTVFRTNLTNKKRNPAGYLLKKIEKEFCSYDKLKLIISKTLKGIDGNGWGILGFQPYTQKLTVVQCENHENLTCGVMPPL